MRGRAAEQHSRRLFTKGFIGHERSAATDDAVLNRRRTGRPDRNTFGSGATDAEEAQIYDLLSRGRDNHREVLGPFCLLEPAASSCPATCGVRPAWLCPCQQPHVMPVQRSDVRARDEDWEERYLKAAQVPVLDHDREVESDYLQGRDVRPRSAIDGERQMTARLSASTLLPVSGP